MRSRAAAILTLAAATSLAVIGACSSPVRPPSIDPWNVPDGGGVDEALLPPPYVPQEQACVRDGGAPAAFVPGADASADAAHPRAPQVLSAGGAVVSLPTFVAVTFPGDDLRGEEEDFVASVGCTDYWRTVASDYGVGQGVAGQPVHLTESAPANIDDSEIKTWLADTIASGGFPAPDANTVFVLFYPSGTSITLQGARSCAEFEAYHGSAPAGSMQVPYAVIPHCLFVAGLTPLDEVTTATSHELIEAVSDPVPDTKPAYSLPDRDGWGFAIAGGSEIGDMCEFKTDAVFRPAGYSFKVQRIWSNQNAFAFDDPCQPAMPGPFFAAAPRFIDTISVDFGGGAQPLPGITAPLGQPVTVDIVAFANGPTSAWQIVAYDAAQVRQGTAELGLTLDKVSVQDGDVAHLTIVRKAPPQLGASAFGIASSSGGRQAFFWGLAK